MVDSRLCSIIYEPHSTAFLAELHEKTVSLSARCGHRIHSNDEVGDDGSELYMYLPHIRLVDRVLLHLDPPDAIKTPEQESRLKDWIARRLEIKKQIMDVRCTLTHHRSRLTDQNLSVWPRD